MNTENIENPIPSQWDTMLAHLPGKSKGNPKALFPLPYSKLGQQLLTLTKDSLSAETQCDGSSDIIDEADGTVQVGYDDELWWRIDEISWSISEEIRQNAVAKTTSLLNALEAELQRKFGDALNEELSKKLMEGVNGSQPSDALSEFNAVLAEKLPDLIQDSVSWRFDTSAMSRFLSDQIDNVLKDSVLQTIARNICVAEVEQAHQFMKISAQSSTGELNHG